MRTPAACALMFALSWAAAPTQARVVKRFDAFAAIDHRSGYDLVLTDRGLPGTVRIEGPEDAVGLVTSALRDGVLHIAAEPTRNFLPELPFFDAQLKVRHKIRITVSCRGLARVKTDGEGTLTADNFRFRDLAVEARGGGTLTFRNCQFYSLQASVAGNSSARFVNSQAVDVRFKLEGDGAIHAHTLRTRNLDARVFGGGLITAYPRELLKAKVAGKGAILYRGNPSTLEKEVAEGGRIGKYLVVDSSTTSPEDPPQAKPESK